MRIGYLIDTHKGGYDQPLPGRADVGDTLDGMIEEGLIAERSGFHSLQVPDRHGRTETYWPGPLQILTVLARETETIALGSYALVLTLYPPMLVAEQCAVIDNLSRGRLYMTLARGYHPGYWEYFGVPQERLLGRFREGIRFLEEAYKGERFSFQGEFYEVEDAILSPQPWQQPRFPFWGGGQFPASIRRAADWAENWSGDPFPLLKEVWDEQSGAYRERARELGKEPFVVLMRDGWVGDTFEDAVDQFCGHYTEEMRFYMRHGQLQHHPDFASEDDLVPERLGGHAVMGSKDDCIEQLEKYRRDYGVDYVVMRFRMPTGPSLEETREQIQRFGEEVCSHFNAAYPAPDHPSMPEGVRPDVASA